MKTSSFLRLSIAISFIFSGIERNVSAALPNIVVILTDDKYDTRIVDRQNLRKMWCF